MTNTLFDIALEVVRELNTVRSGLVTGSATITTLLDGVRRTSEPDDYWKNGTVFMVETTDGLAPEKEWAVVLASTVLGAITFETLSATTTIGDRYSIINAMYPIDMIVNAINSALNNIYISAHDTTSLDTIAGQLEYDLPAGVESGNLLNIYIDIDGRWIENHSWDIMSGGTGKQNILVFHSEPESNRDIRIDYIVRHPSLYDSIDELSESVHIERVKWDALVNVYGQAMEANDTRKYTSQRMNFFLEMSDIAEREHPIWMPKKNSRYSVIRRSGRRYPGDRSNLR